MNRPPISGHDFDCLLILSANPGIKPQDFALALLGDMPVETAHIRGNAQLTRLKQRGWAEGSQITYAGLEALLGFVEWIKTNPLDLQK